MKYRSTAAPACQDESAERREFRLQTVDPAFEPADILGRHRSLGDAVRDPAGGIRKAGADGKQVALNLFQHWPQVGLAHLGVRKTEPGIELIDLAVRPDTRIVLADSRAVEEAGIAGISGPGVDFHFLIMDTDEHRQTQKSRRERSVPGATVAN
jgi:hypothetical protein